MADYRLVYYTRDNSRVGTRALVDPIIDVSSLPEWAELCHIMIKIDTINRDKPLGVITVDVIGEDDAE